MSVATVKNAYSYEKCNCCGNEKTSPRANKEVHINYVGGKHGVFLTFCPDCARQLANILNTEVYRGIV